jgi:ABC-2 type transport system permease protein
VIGPFRAELLKLRTTRTTLGIALSSLAIVAFTTVIPLALADRETTPDVSLWNPETQRAVFMAPVAATMFAAFAGLLLVTGEFRHGTIRPTFVFVPRRVRVVVAKVGASMLAGAALGLAAVGACYAVALPWLEVRDVYRFLDREQLAEMAAGAVVACVLWAAIGVGVGALVRNQVGGIVALIAWSIVESVLGSTVPTIGRFTPGQAANALAGSEAVRLTPTGGLAVLGAWAVACALAGVVATARRDVP